MYNEKLFIKIAKHILGFHFTQDNYSRLQPLYIFSQNTIVPFTKMLGGNHWTPKLCTMRFECIDNLEKFSIVLHTKTRNNGHNQKPMTQHKNCLLDISLKVDGVGLVTIKQQLFQSTMVSCTQRLTITTQSFYKKKNNQAVKGHFCWAI